MFFPKYILLNTVFFTETEENKYTPHPDLMELSSYMNETSKQTLLICVI